MKRFTSILILPLFMANVAIAHPAGKDDAAHNSPAHAGAEPFDIANLKLPTQAEIDAITEQMPDMNAILGDMQSLMSDEEFKGGMKTSLNILSDRMSTHTRRTGKDGMPDMNAMFADMLGLMADEEFVGGMTGAIAPMQEIMNKHIPEAAKTAPRKKSKHDH